MAYGDALAADVRVDGPVPVMSSGGITGCHDVPNTLAPCIVVGRKGSYGSVHWSDVPAFVIDTAYFIDRRFTSCDLRWLYYALRSVDLRGVSQDVGVPGLSREAAYGVALPRVPPPDEQRRIADFLDDQVGLLDRAIDLRQQQKALSEERFRFEIAEHYDVNRPDRSRLRLQDVLAHPPCYGVLVPIHVHEGVPFVRIDDLPAIERGEQPLASIPATQSAEYKRTIVAVGDVLTSVVGTLGSAAIVPQALAGANIARAVCRLQPKSNVSSWFLRGWLASPQFLALAELATGAGTAQATLNMGDLRKFPIGLPDPGATHVLGAKVQNLFEQQGALRNLLDGCLALLRERKQASITAAVTGQFDVTTARAVA